VELGEVSMAEGWDAMWEGFLVEEERKKVRVAGRT